MLSTGNQAVRKQIIHMQFIQLCNLIRIAIVSSLRLFVDTVINDIHVME